MIALPGTTELILVLVSLVFSAAFLFGVVYFAVRMANRSK